MIICMHELSTVKYWGEDTMGKKDKKEELSKEEIARQRALVEAVVGDYRYKSEAQETLTYTIERLAEIGMKLAAKKERKVVNQISSRIKNTDSIYKKIRRKGYSVDKEGVFRCNDLLGVRMVCLFMDDVYEIAACLKEQEDIRILKEKDYIRKPKSNGYMSLHLILEIPQENETNDTLKWKKVEVQLRTVAMDFWSVLDHQLVYKKEFPGADSVGKELKAYAATIAELDNKMLELRKKIDSLKV